ncbi:metallophosphoesterase family protein [Desulfofustis glycolicus]|nr:metallophosphoesterase [Desulfofustis glycolicus]
MIKKIGILSDTHRTSCDPAFTLAVMTAFQGCDTIAHAGDVTDARILAAFHGKRVYAVHGNMCTPSTRSLLPESLSFSVGGYLIALCHGHRADHDRAGYLLGRFPEADAIIFGHTHQPVIQNFGSTLLINPGSFRSTGRYGSPGNYALLTITETGLHAELHERTVVS